MLLPVSDILSEIEGMMFVERGERCIQCNEEFIPEEEGSRTIAAAKRLGIWGHPLKLHRKLSKSTGGTILRIPGDIERDMHLTGTEHALVSRIGRNRMLVEIEEAHE